MYMLVYRFENIMGDGPYAQEGMENLDIKHSSSLTRLPPDLDGIWDWNPEIHRCACISLDSLKKWFKGFLRQLKRNEFKIVVYDVPEELVLFGIKQIVFEKKDAKFIEEIK